ncbi:MAG: stage V sporulation protein T [Clostridiales bacterium]|nr:stage V sporulation protein T [Clostridiales bacterium]MCD8333581.1 stage V sporulation protein T [Clostridiales bacterium]
MKATGIVRRIDDLGRVVVPKEIRRTLRIREGDPLEIFTDREGEIIFKKYSPIGELSAFAGQYAECLAQTTGCLVCVSDRDHIISAAGNHKKDYEGKPISRQLEAMIDKRAQRVSDKNDSFFIKLTADDGLDYRTQAISTIISEGDAIGSVILCSQEEKEASGDTCQKLVQTAAGFLGKQMEQ